MRIKFDNELKFDTHVTSLCNKASQKLHALARVAKYMNFKQCRVHEIIYKCSIWLLPDCMDVPQQITEQSY